VADTEIIPRVERRRKWSLEEKAALVAEIEAEGGKVKRVARRHRIAESLLYNWRAAWKAAAAAVGSQGTVEFVPLGVMPGSRSNSGVPATLTGPAAMPAHQPDPRDNRLGGIEIALPDGSRVSVDTFVNEQALARVLRAMKSLI
jgi:transposase-like protein